MGRRNGRSLLFNNDHLHNGYQVFPNTKFIYINLLKMFDILKAIVALNSKHELIHWCQDPSGASVSVDSHYLVIMLSVRSNYLVLVLVLTAIMISC